MPGHHRQRKGQGQPQTATKTLIRETESQIVINVGSAFLNMSVLRACIDT
eukprot:gene44674-55590_t